MAGADVTDSQSNKKTSKKKTKNRKKDKIQATHEPSQPKPVDEDDPDDVDDVAPSKPAVPRKRGPRLGRPRRTGGSDDPVTLVEEEGRARSSSPHPVALGAEGNEGSASSERRKRRDPPDADAADGRTEGLATEASRDSTGPSEVDFAGPDEQDPSSRPLALSRLVCRFRVPVDLRLLQTLRPDDYLRRYCVPESFLACVLHRTFQKHKIEEDVVPPEALATAVTGALGQPLTDDQRNLLLELAGLGDEDGADGPLFAGLCCLAMRMLCRDRSAPTDRDLLETMDFASLRLHWHGLATDDGPARRLLEFVDAA